MSDRYDNYDSALEHDFVREAAYAEDARVARGLAAGREDWPVHQPECFDAPILGRQWYAGCEPGGDLDHETGLYHGSGPRVNPATGVCEGCGEQACRECGLQNCPDHGEVSGGS